MSLENNLDVVQSLERSGNYWVYLGCVMCFQSENLKYLLVFLHNFSPFSSDEEFLSLQSKKLCVAPVVPSQKNQASDEAKKALSK